MMSFEDNLFSNVADNPFEDPSVRQATNSASNASRGLEDYNPFEDPIPTSSQPAVMQATEQPPVYTKSAQIGGTDMRRRQDELDRQAAELARKEEEVRQKTAELQRNEEELKRKAEQLDRTDGSQMHNVRRNNWPPLPEGFFVQPCFYMDIELEIKPEFQTMVRRMYYIWLMHGYMLILNFIGGLALLIQFGSVTTFGVSILYLVLFTPLSFLCWYRPYYKALRDDSSFNFLFFFFVFFFQFIVTTFMALGILGSGSCGLFTAIGCFDKTVGGTTVGVLILIISFGWAGLAAIEMLMLGKMLNVYRGSGASINKARNEFTAGIMRDPMVNNAKETVIKNATSSAFGR